VNRPHAEQKKVCYSTWGQQLRKKTESSSVLYEDRVYPLIEVATPKRMNAYPYNSHTLTKAQPHKGTCRPTNKF